jgi:tetratricopeptide (TPR) repeat protein
MCSSSSRFALLALAMLVTACGASGAGGAAPRSVAATKHEDASNQIFGPRAQGTARELRARAEEALLAQRWQDAVDALEPLLAADVAAANDPQLVYDLALAYEGTSARARARERYRELVHRFPDDPNARSAVVREVSLDAYLEDWPALGAIGETLLSKPNADPAERMLGFGARGLSRSYAGDEAGAFRDVNSGLELVDEHRYGATGQLPVAAAMLKFGLGEVRKTRSEKVSLDPPGPDFVQKLELRCMHLLDAQAAYADAIRSVDPHWAAMSGFRVGEMYRQLHEHLMNIPPNDKAKTESDKQLFFGIMHVRYRVLLEKGIEMMKRTLALGEKTGAASAWMKRAEASHAEMERALEEEKVQLAKYPFTEAELQKALELMKRNYDKQHEKAASKPTTQRP